MADRVVRRYVSTPGGLIHIAEAGEGPLLLLAHGNPWAGSFWDGLLPVLADAGYRALAFDALGYGLSDRADAALTIDEQAQGLADLVAALGTVPAAIVGWHQGAVVALAMALARPELCPVLVMDGAGTESVEAARAMIRLVIAHNPRRTRAGDPAAWWMEMATGRLRLFNPHFRPEMEANWPLVERMLFGMLRADPALTAGGSPMVPVEARPVPGTIPYYDWLASLAGFTAPLLILTAEDEPLRAAHEPALAAAPHAEEWVFSGGHPLIGIGREAEYAAPILRFLAGMTTAASGTCGLTS